MLQVGRVPRPESRSTSSTELFDVPFSVQDLNRDPETNGSVGYGESPTLAPALPRHISDGVDAIELKLVSH